MNKSFLLLLVFVFFSSNFAIAQTPPLKLCYSSKSNSFLVRPKCKSKNEITVNLETLAEIGAVGPQGPQGPNGVTNYSRYISDTESVLIQPRTSHTLSVECPLGQKPTSGVCDFGVAAYADVMTSFSISNSPTTGSLQVNCLYVNIADYEVSPEMTAHAICIDAQ